MRFNENSAFEETTELKLYYCGHEQCKPGHSCGPAMRDHYLFVYIKSGKGIFKSGNKTYELCGGDSFVMYPEVPAFYKASNDNPWEYIWLGLVGRNTEKFLELAGFHSESPIHHHIDIDNAENLLSRILEFPSEKSIDQVVKCLGILYEFLSILIKDSREESGNTKPAECTMKEEYIQQAIRYIQLHYAESMTVTSIAEYIGLDRSYFSKLFKYSIGRSPYEFLLKYRMDKAIRLLTHTSATVRQVALSVGYENPLHFTRLFKKHMGLPPAQYRRTR